jgi:hypothetical protein
MAGPTAKKLLEGKKAEILEEVDRVSGYGLVV